MASKGEQRVKIALICTVCKNRNYITTRNKVNTPEKIKLKKFCKHCRKVTEHRETEKLKQCDVLPKLHREPCTNSTEKANGKTGRTDHKETEKLK